MKRSPTVAVAIAILHAGATMAGEHPVISYTYDGTYEDALFAVENAIVSKGLKVDSVSHIGDMLARTKVDIGATQDIYDDAVAFQFCSATLSRKVMEADPLNLAHCPYRIFVFEKEGAVVIGHVAMPEGIMQEVEALLTEIAESALDGF